MRAREEALKHDVLLSLLDYDPETGVFRWKRVTSNRQKVGGIAGQRCKGAVIIQINGWRYMAHRLAWFYVHHRWPKEEIDHINRRPDDNRLVNLRQATRNENNRNVGRKSHNTSGFKGVTKHKQYKREKWMAQILVDKRNIYLGVFDTPDEAHAAYCVASKRYHGDFGRADNAV